MPDELCCTSGQDKEVDWCFYTTVEPRRGATQGGPSAQKSMGAPPSASAGILCSSNYPTVTSLRVAKEPFGPVLPAPPATGSPPSISAGAAAFSWVSSEPTHPSWGKEAMSHSA